MVKVTLGSTGITVNKNGFGALPIQRISHESSTDILRRAYEAGIDFYDTARFYTDSECKLGEALSDVREHIYIATKTAAKNADEFWKDITTSLNNLKTDYWRRENEYTAEQKVCCPELCISGRHAGGHDPGLHRGLDLPPGAGCGGERHQRRRHGAGTSGHPVPEYDVLHRGAHGVFVHCRVCGYHEEPQTGRQDHGHHRADLRHHRRHRCSHHDRHYEDLPPGSGALDQPD